MARRLWGGVSRLYSIHGRDTAGGQLGENEAAAFGFRDGIAKFERRLDPELGGIESVAQGFSLRRAVSYAAGQFGYFRHIGIVLGAPANPDFILDHGDEFNP